ncbi:MAG: hypothetical protein K2M47_06700 [Clostridiales bacterium]|nr:hypothetical protein [Clostridiales bacterium]
MAKSSKTISTVISVVFVVLIVALLVGVIFTVRGVTENGQRNFYVQYGNEKVGALKKDIKLETGSAHVFYCGTVTGQSVDYDVEIYVNTDNFDNFDFEVDSRYKNFKKELSTYDCSALFGVVKNDTCFFVSMPSELTMYAIIQSKYDDSTVTGIPDCELSKPNSFILSITDRVEKTTTQIYFC